MNNKLFLLGCIIAMCLWGCDDSSSMSISHGSSKPGASSSGGNQGQGGDGGQNGGDGGQNGGDGGQNGGDGGQNGGDGGQNGGDGGQNGGDGGQNGGDGGDKPDLPYDVVGGIASDLEGIPCNEGERYCDWTDYVECQNNRYIILEKCADNPEKNQCYSGVGCSLCEPNTTFCKDGGNDVYQCSADGSSISFVKSCVSEACSNGACEVWGCPLDAQFIYLVDESYHLIKFNPGDKSGNYFTVLHTLNCSSTGATPFSMAVDREANAWVLYSDSTLYKVDINTNKCETITKFNTNGSGLSTFGMGFSLDEIGGSHDTLYIADINKSGAYGSINTETMKHTQLAKFSSKYENTPELTGTGLAKLYAFSPGPSVQYIEEIDKKTGNVIKSYTLPGAGGSIWAWAFAHWGGQFFAFYTVGGNNSVYRFTIETNKFELFVDNTPYRVVGAGVSTCAPVEIN